MDSPEARARKNIDDLLDACGWAVQHYHELNLSAGRGVAVREFPLKAGFADYALFVDRRIIGAVEAKSEGTPSPALKRKRPSTALACPPSHLPGIRRCHSSMKAPASRPFSPMDWIPTRAAAACLLFIGPRRWPTGRWMPVRAMRVRAVRVRAIRESPPRSALACGTCRRS